MFWLFPQMQKCVASCFSRCKCVLVISPDVKNVWLRVSLGASVLWLFPQMQKCVASSVSPAVETSCGKAADKVGVWKEFLINLSRPL